MPTTPAATSHVVCFPRAPSAASTYAAVLARLSALATLICAFPAAAQQLYGPSDTELIILPPYCKVRLADNRRTPEWQKWESVLGREMNDIHHYCYALNWINRAAKTVDDQNRQTFLTAALDDIRYVENAARPDFVLLPELYLNKGNALRLLGRGSEAAQAFLKAIYLKPDYSPPYAALSDYYLDLDNTEEALKILEQGLEKAPESKLLARKLAEIRRSTPKHPP